MSCRGHTLHILFFPLMAPGHMLPMLDMAKLFSARGHVEATIVTTPANSHLIQPYIDDDTNNNNIHLSLLPFPHVEGLPKGCENLSSVPEDLRSRFASALQNLREPFDHALKHLHPDCIVSDMFLPWTADVASEHGIPRLFFHGSNFFAQCVSHSIEQHNLLDSFPAEEECFVIPGLAHHIVLRRSMVPDIQKLGPSLAETFRQIKESESKNYGTVTNTFYELEPDYADYYRNVKGIKAWNVGPLSLCNKDIVEKSRRGEKASIDYEVCLEWLDSKKPRSIVYVCFGSLFDISTAQLQEIAVGLEASKSPFIWVVRKGSEEWMPQGFEERTKGKGLVIRGWAPQILILNHGSIGGYVTHCGWNSSLEGMSAGLPCVTWPLSAEQFYTERLIVDVLKIGVAIGMKEFTIKAAERETIEAARIERAIAELMGEEEEAEERRRRARELGELARKAVEKDGSSYIDLDNLIAELMERKTTVVK